MNENIIFIHIPKTAGVAISHSLRDIGGLKQGYGFSHQIARNIIKKKDRKCIIMAVVRNPYDRLYSIYEFYSKKRDDIDKNISFEEFILTFEKKYYLSGPQFDTCFNFLIDRDNKLMPTDILRFESLHDDYNLFCEKYKIKNNLIYRNVNDKKNTNIDWSKLYTLQMRNIVERIFKMDFMTFNYSYEEFLANKKKQETRQSGLEKMKTGLAGRAPRAWATRGCGGKPTDKQLKEARQTSDIAAKAVIWSVHVIKKS